MKPVAENKHKQANRGMKGKEQTIQKQNKKTIIAELETARLTMSSRSHRLRSNEKFFQRIIIFFSSMNENNCVGHKERLRDTTGCGVVKEYEGK